MLKTPVVVSVCACFYMAHTYAHPQAHPGAEKARSMWAEYARKIGVSEDGLSHLSVAERLEWRGWVSPVQRQQLDEIFLSQLRGDFRAGTPSQIVEKL